MHLFDNESYSLSLFIFSFRKKGGKKGKIPHDRLVNVYHAERVNINRVDSLSNLAGDGHRWLVVASSCRSPCLPRCGIRYGTALARRLSLSIRTHHGFVTQATWVSHSWPSPLLAGWSLWRNRDRSSARSRCCGALTWLHATRLHRCSRESQLVARAHVKLPCYLGIPLVICTWYFDSIFARDSDNAVRTRPHADVISKPFFILVPLIYKRERVYESGRIKVHRM